MRRFTDQGAYVEVEPGVEGFLHTRNMSWTKKVKYPGQILRKKQELDVLVLNVDEERKLLELGLRELEDSPWEKFETIFIPGTVHEGTVVKLFPKGVAAIVELSYGLECKVESDQLIKADKNLLQEEEIAQFVVLDFSREKQRVLISHTATFDKKAGQINTKNRNQSDRAIDSFVQKKTKTTLGDLTALSDLKDKLARQKDTKEEK